MKPLENVRILDLSRVLAGPFCTMILADLGAEVIKVEVPETGDDSRQFGPFKNNKSLYFISINRGKKSISVNLKTEKGKNIIKQLVQKCDVVIENFRPGTMEKLGLGYDVLKEINPKIIYAAGSGFGHTGPDSAKPAYDVLVQAAGVMSITGWPNMPPTRVGISVGDITAALYLAIAINAALYQQKVTGLGTKIDIAMLDCQVAILENAIMRYQVENKNPEPIGNRHPTITPFQAFKAKDVYFVVGVGNDNMWKIFCEIIGRVDLINHEKFATNKLRTENIAVLNEILDNIFVTKNAEEWLKIFEDGKLPCGPINTIDKLLENKQVQHRNMIVDIEDKDLGKLKVVGTPIKMTTAKDETFKKPAPEIGEHNFEILENLLGYSKQDIQNLLKENVL